MSERRYGYFSSQSFIHRMDAISKFVWVFVVSMLSFVFWEPWQLALQIVILFLIALSFSRHNLGPMLRAWLLFALLGSFIMFFHVISRHTGTIIWRAGWFSIYSNGLRLGLMYAFRVISIMGSSYIFVQSTSPRELVVGLVHLGVPYKYAWMIFLSLLSIPVFEAEAVTVREAQLVRGVRPAANPIQERLQMYQRYVLPLLVSGLRRVEGLGIAMDSRGFAAYSQRTFIDTFRWSFSGVLFMCFWVAVFIMLLAVRVFIIH
jgi:energy-coupling factor transport system permease protein